MVIIVVIMIIVVIIVVETGLSAPRLGRCLPSISGCAHRDYGGVS